MSPDRAYASTQTEERFEEMLLLPTTGNSCPYMGLEGDGSIMLSEPSPLHRCFATDKARMPRIEFQEQYCLHGAHVRCATYQGAEGAAPAPVMRDVWTPIPETRKSRWPLLSAIALLLALLAGYAVMMRPWEQVAAMLPARQPAVAAMAAVAPPVIGTVSPVAVAAGSDVLLTIAPPVAAEAGSTEAGSAELTDTPTDAPAEPAAAAPVAAAPVVAAPATEAPATEAPASHRADRDYASDQYAYADADSIACAATCVRAAASGQRGRSSRAGSRGHGAPAPGAHNQPHPRRSGLVARR